MSGDLRAELEKYLETLNIQTSCVDHPPVKVTPGSGFGYLLQPELLHHKHHLAFLEKTKHIY